MVMGSEGERRPASRGEQSKQQQTQVAKGTAAKRVPRVGALLCAVRRCSVRNSLAVCCCVPHSAKDADRMRTRSGRYGARAGPLRRTRECVS